MKTDCDYLLLILNCEKYRNKALIQKQLWLHYLPENIKYYHIIGNKEKCQNETIVIDEKERIIYTNTNDDYNSLPSKVITALQGVNQHFNFKYIFKTDDDQQLVKPQFFHQLPNIINSIQSHYGGYNVEVPDHISSYYMVHDCLPRDLLLNACNYCNGRFYFLSKEAVTHLITKKTSIEKHIIEDHAIGLYLDDNYKANMMNFDTRKIFIDHIT